MNINIRHALEKDLTEMVEIFNQAIQTRTSTGYLDKFTVDERKEWFSEHAKEKYPILVAEQNEKIVGWISLDPYRKGRKAFEKTGELSLFIHNNFKRKGIGNQLLLAMMKTAKKTGI
jgi:phosphinothricin acetyltransferase